MAVSSKALHSEITTLSSHPRESLNLEIEENQILEENLKRLLDQDKKKVWNNCFSGESSSEEKSIVETEVENLYSSEGN